MTLPKRAKVFLILTYRDISDNGAGIDTRPEGALPVNYVLNGWDGVSYSHTRSLGRRLSTASVTFDVSREAHRVRVQGQANCLVERPWDPCGAPNGSLGRPNGSHVPLGPLVP